jgi:hypothetical protein
MPSDVAHWRWVALAVGMVGAVAVRAAPRPARAADVARGRDAPSSSSASRLCASSPPAPSSSAWHVGLHAHNTPQPPLTAHSWKRSSRPVTAANPVRSSAARATSCALYRYACILGRGGCRQRVRGAVLSQRCQQRIQLRPLAPSHARPSPPAQTGSPVVGRSAAQSRFHAAWLPPCPFPPWSPRHPRRHGPRRPTTLQRAGGRDGTNA